MQEQAIAIYCACEETVRFFGLVDGQQCKMTTGEITPFTLIPAAIANAIIRKRAWFQRLLAFPLRH